VHQQRPAYLLNVSSILHQRRELVPGRLGMAIRRAHHCRFLEQKGRSTWCHRWNRIIRLNHNDHSFYTGRMERFRRWIPRHRILTRDFVLLAASVYLLKQDLLRLLIEKLQSDGSCPHQFSAPGGTSKKIRLERSKNQVRTRCSDL